MPEPTAAPAHFTGMMKPRTPVTSAPMAIAAVLALASTAGVPAMAQSAPDPVSPAIAAPAAPIAAPPATPAASTPAIVLPPVAATAPEPAPQPQAVPEPPMPSAAATPAQARPHPAASRSQVRRVAPVSVPANRIATQPVSPLAGSPPRDTVAPTTPPPATAMRPLPDAANPPPAVQPPPDNNGSSNAWGAGIALLAALGLGGALFAMRSRRRDERLDEDVAYGEVAPEPMVPVSNGVDSPVTVEQVSVPSASPATTMVDAESVDSTLIEEMVAAPPDADNPFKTRKMRRRRARALLAERAAQDAVAEPPARSDFDWRTYQPSMARAETEKV